MKNKYTISEIKERLKGIDNEKNDLFQSFLLDERKGVQTAIRSWRKDRKKEFDLIQQFNDMNVLENNLIEEGYSLIGGIDEVGRGPLAGPIVSAVVVLDPSKKIIGLNDSKQLSEKKRHELFKQIKEEAWGYGIGYASVSEIDHYNIYQATKLAMKRAVENNTTEIEQLLVDAMTVDTSIPQQSIIKGDSKSNSIAAASILAKVTRDELMKEYEKQFPGYDFSNNAGYGTKKHLEGLNQLGPCSIHRTTFSPVKSLL